MECLSDFCFGFQERIQNEVSFLFRDLNRELIDFWRCSLLMAVVVDDYLFHTYPVDARRERGCNIHMYDSNLTRVCCYFMCTCNSIREKSFLYTSWFHLTVTHKYTELVRVRGSYSFHTVEKNSRKIFREGSGGIN